MLSNQGQAVNNRYGFPLCPFNFIQHDNQDGLWLALCCVPSLLGQILPLTNKYYVNQDICTAIFCDCGDELGRRP